MRIQCLPQAMVALLMMSGVCLAGEADVVGVTATKASDGTWSFHVTVLHGDEGWDHYANRWDVIAPDGTVLGTRTLHHPHETEQPFTRSLGGVRVPDGVVSVTIRANDSVHGTGGKEFSVELSK
ncbi:hypothetical protein [Anderseniella sp. Alg231-50]|uniref:hypothetical protein n=1 Tax=Anderseniella sp. Alg231-50 TaxID=1922226 RepID=UPI000D54C1DD